MLIPGLKKLTVYTRFAPPFDIDPNEVGGQPNWIDRLFQPHVTADFLGQELVLYSPFGKPASLFVPLVAAGLGLVAVVGAIVVRKKRRS